MKILLAALGVAGMFVATSSIAGEGYVGVSTGILDFEDDSAGPGFSVSDTLFNFKVFGGYELNENFALDVAYFRTSESAEFNIFGTTVDISVDGFTLRGVGSYPIRDNFSILGSIGFWDGDTENSKSGFPADVTSEDGITLGVGGKYRFESVSIRADFEWFDSDDTIRSLLVGVQVNFGGE
jgi:OOP family OmpA-OmpF porin